MYRTIADDVLYKNVTHYSSMTSTDLLTRWDEHQSWLDRRLAMGLDPYSKQTSSRIEPECHVNTRDGRGTQGVNFGSQDYLNLSSHPAVKAAAKAAIDNAGLHSAGSAALMGNTSLSVELERRLAEFLGYSDCTLFPTGWGAGYGVIKTLVRPTDHVVIDRLAHACLVEGAYGATKNVHFFQHLSYRRACALLAKIRSAYPADGILLVTETVFSMDSDVPQIRELQDACNQYDATLLVDVAHDLGAIGDKGKGYLELQDCIGFPDILMGSFSKTFATNGGFVASNSASLKLALRYNCGPLTFTNAISPVQCAIIGSCLDVIEADEGRDLREKLMSNSLHMRQRMAETNFTVLGQPSAIIPVLLGDSALSRLANHYAYNEGAITNLVEYPAVRKNACRWRIQMMARHDKGQIDKFVQIACGAVEAAKQHLDYIKREDNKEFVAAIGHRDAKNAAVEVQAWS